MGWDMAGWGESAVQEKNLGKTDCTGLVPDRPPFNTDRSSRASYKNTGNSDECSRQQAGIKSRSRNECQLFKGSKGLMLGNGL